MKYTLCILSILILILASCKDKLEIGDDQSTSFIKFYGNIWADNGNDVKSIPVSTAFPGGGYAIAGYTTKTINRNPGDKDMLFLILDQYGNIVGKPKKMGGPGEDEVTRVDVLSKGTGFILTGSRTLTLRGHTQTHASVMRLDAKGDSVWNYISDLSWSNAEKALNIHIDSVTNIYTVVGYQTIGTQQKGWIFDLHDQGSNYSIGSFNDTISVAPPGDVSQSTTPNFEFKDLGILSPSTVNALASISLPSGPGIPVKYRSAKFFIDKRPTGLKKGDAGDAWNRRLNDSPRQMIILPGNKAICLSSIDTINTSTHFIQLAIVDDPTTLTSRVTYWYYYDTPPGFGGGSLDAVKMKYSAGDSTYTILGTLTPSAASSNSSIVLIKINGTNGAEIWRRTIGINDAYVAGGLDITPDGGYIITGYNNTGGYNQSVLIIKTNKDGNIE